MQSWLKNLNKYSELTAFIIEDEPTKSAILNHMLGELGVNQICIYETGLAGLEDIVQADERCILFLDLMLPDINGQEILRRLAAKHFKGFVMINSVCEPRIVQNAVNIAANSGIRLLGALSPDYTIEQLRYHLDRCTRGPYSLTVHADHVLLDAEGIHKAFDEDRIIPYYQPIVNFFTQKVVGLECLARVITEDGTKILSPVSFYGPLVDMAFLDNLSFRLYGKALKTLSEPFFADSHVKLAINIEPSQLISSSFPKTMHAMTEHAGIEPGRIIFELTEQSPVNQDIQLESINILRLEGYDIAIDDFGSGYTNIKNLHSIPFNRLKIDRHLIQNINEDTFCQVAIDSILSLAAEVNAEVVLEGIENEDQLSYTTRHKQVCLQGFYLSKAVSIEHLIDWIKNSPYSLA